MLGYAITPSSCMKARMGEGWAGLSCSTHLPMRFGTAGQTRTGQTEAFNGKGQDGGWVMLGCVVATTGKIWVLEVRRYSGWIVGPTGEYESQNGGIELG